MYRNSPVVDPHALAAGQHRRREGLFRPPTVVWPNVSIGCSDGELLIEKLNKANIGGKEVHVQATQCSSVYSVFPMDALRRILGSAA